MDWSGLRAFTGSHFLMCRALARMESISPSHGIQSFQVQILLGPREARWGCVETYCAQRKAWWGLSVSFSLCGLFFLQLVFPLEGQHWEGPALGGASTGRCPLSTVKEMSPLPLKSEVETRVRFREKKTTLAFLIRPGGLLAGSRADHSLRSTQDLGPKPHLLKMGKCSHRCPLCVQVFGLFLGWCGWLKPGYSGVPGPPWIP